MDDEAFLRKAIELSINNVKIGGGPFGAIIVKAGRIVSSGVNQVVTLNDPTAHAEIMAIREAALNLNSFDLSGCAIYTSCEPCPMCLSAIYWARIGRVYFGAGKEEAARYGFDDLAIGNEVKKNLEERSIPMFRMLSHEAVGAFEAWKEKEDKRPY